ncbi:hypothetical protein EJD97_008383 [Solanum chilense]|uniref:ARID domain-containing protein n=1 Tax=Solanum chilense TaxID=4083 RepID=A0A6N2BUM1_SOLCI|nr:hypothetical protein EJD97_008383 [Solanum chilense]
MDEWLRLDDGSLIFKENKGSDSAINGGKSRFRRMFDDVFAVFLSQKPEKKSVWSFPVLSGSGKPIDLFKLFWIVRKLGGYDLVSYKNLWGCVAERCGPDTGAVASLKLVYAKYLREFDHWLKAILKDGNLVEGEVGVIGKLDSLLKELETMFGNLFRSENGCKEELICNVNSQVDYEMFTAESVSDSKHRSCNAEHRKHNLNNGGEKSFSKIANDTVFLVSTEGIVEKILRRAPAKSNRQYDDEEKFSQMIGMREKENNDKEKVSVLNGSDTTVAAGKSVIEDVTASHKRKRGSPCYSEMLNWLKHAAKHSNDPEIGPVLKSLNWKGHTGKDFWFQALAIREVLLKKSHIDTDAGEAKTQKKQRMQPSMYEEEKLNNQPAENLRCSKRIPNLQKHTLCRGCSLCPIARNKVETHQKKEDDIAPDLVSVEVSVTEKSKAAYELPRQKAPKVDIGGQPRTAEVPEWTGVISESDAKWLGARMWPPEVEKTNPLVVLDPVGKGRQSSCDCRFPGSAECNRFHIADQRYKFSRELGPLFTLWRFHKMGEEVSLSWTDEDQEKFKVCIKPSVSQKNNVWRNFKELFPSKTRNMLVSYYFNVFLIRRRTYQNRVTPKDLDSDDDEKEVGRVGGNFGDAAVYVPSSKCLLTCSENKVCTDLQ